MPFDRTMLIFVVFSMGGCVVTQSARPVVVGHRAVEVHPFQDVALAAPPPILAPQPPMAPVSPSGPMLPGPPGQVWVDGHFNLVSNRYVWEPGHWQAPPRPGLHWQQPTWHQGQWFPGYWTDHSPMPAVYTQQGPWNPGWHGTAPRLGVPTLHHVATAVPTALAYSTSTQPLVLP